MVPALNPVRYPAMRAELIGAIRALSDPIYQEQVWVQRNYPHPDFFDDLDTNIHILFDDTQVLPDPETALGTVLYPGETSALRGLAEALDPLIEELGEAPDEIYLNNEAWPNVVEQAQQALQVLLSNEQAPQA
jgi:hypothetical protein